MRFKLGKKAETYETIGHLINGVEVPGDGRAEPVTNPATGKVTRHVAMASKQTVESAIAAAAATGWLSRTLARNLRSARHFAHF